MNSEHIFGESDQYRRLRPGEAFEPGDEWYEGSAWVVPAKIRLRAKKWHPRMAPVRRPMVPTNG